MRDQDGAAVAGARVEALDAAGRTVGLDRSAADGTFALSTPVRPAALRVRAENSDPVRIAVPAEGPVTAIVTHNRAADRVPSPADVAALPAGSLAELGSVIPYRVAFPGALGDRYLDRAHGVTTVEGLPFYRGDGSDASSLLPSHAAGSLTAEDPLDAPYYGDRGGGGTVDAHLFDRADPARATDRDASLLLGRGTAVLGATSWDPDGTRRVVAGRAAGTLGPLQASLIALAGDLPNAHYDGIGADLRGATPMLGFRLAAAATRDLDDDATPYAGSVVSLVADAAGHGPNALQVRARWRDERGSANGLASDHRDAALVLGTQRGTESGTLIEAAVALTYGSDAGYQEVPQHALAIVPSLSIDAPLAARWTLHAGAGGSTIGTPGVAIARASLGEAGISYTDHARLHVDLLAYAEGDLAPLATTRGFAAQIGWEIAPRLSLRAWSLRDGDTLQTTYQPYYGEVEQVAVMRSIRRDLVWLTWDAPARIDLLVRAGALEGNVRVPLGPRYALTVGSARRLVTGRRELTIGLTGR